jgi:hypothetical protein
LVKPAVQYDSNIWVRYDRDKMDKYLWGDISPELDINDWRILKEKK